MPQRNHKRKGAAALARGRYIWALDCRTALTNALICAKAAGAGPGLLSRIRKAKASAGGLVRNAERWSAREFEQRAR